MNRSPAVRVRGGSTNPCKGQQSNLVHSQPIDNSYVDPTNDEWHRVDPIDLSSAISYPFDKTPR